ncbi:MAG: preprotein translocase subunit SecA, partial [Oscillospiraceae bacterium]|nr:preprotein translocase subunit SecA [Oscillospiraceae bacterium]
GKYSAMSDEELRGQTEIFKEKYSNGEKLDDILPYAFAAVREAADRVLNKRPFKVQLIGGIVLHQGRVAEMKTGEGKTLVATLPAYLNALTGEGVHIVTVNPYLARVGSEEMGRVYGFLGMSTGLIDHNQSQADKKAAYACDITYGTNSEYGFDYLRDNMKTYKEMLVQRGHVFAIVDEVDSILIDEPRTPLILSGEGDKPTDLYVQAEKFVSKLKEFRIKEINAKEINDDILADYIVDEKARTAVLTTYGITKAESFFKLENLSDAENAEIAHHINQAIKARGVMHIDDDYVIKDGKVLIVDTFTGRIMPGRKYNDGLHQAIEAKEHVNIEKENKTVASITYQNYFRFYKKLSGMTGTALTEDAEFREIYNLDVVEIPTNMPMIRVDHPDVVYKNKTGKYNAIIEQIKECHIKGQPVLVGTVSVEKSEELSRRLKLTGIEHTVLNAKFHDKEAEIVAQAGKIGNVTISTNMAGRGTDILLGGNPEFLAKQEMRKLGYDEEVINFAISFALTDDEELINARELYRDLFAKYKKEIEPLHDKVCELGGLFIVGTERHEARRIDNQLRGRSGRQGDPGESRFFLSLDDDLMRLFGSERILGMVDRLGLEDDQPIEARLLSNSIENAQKQLEGRHFESRKNVLTYDDVMNQQRNVIYKQRMEVLDGVDLKDKVINMMRGMVETVVNDCAPTDENPEWNFTEIRSQFMGLLCGENDFKYTPEEAKKIKPDEINGLLYERAIKIYTDKEKLFDQAFGAGQMREIERTILLTCVDREWMDHIEAMDDLKHSIGLQAYAQRNPVNEYRIQGADMFDEMIQEIRNKTVRTLLSIVPKPEAIKRKEVAKVTGEGFEGSGANKQTQKKTSAPVVKGEKTGRNDLCPCGSGKKYKKCCGMSEDSAE